VFFSIGAAALSVSVLCADLVRYYHSRGLLEQAQESFRKLESLNANYEALLENLEKDPSLIKRIGPATLGVERTDANTIYPKVTVEELNAARKALAKDSSDKSPKSAIPDWLTRCSEPRRRTALFLSGACLILISFLCFNPGRQAGEQKAD